MKLFLLAIVSVCLIASITSCKSKATGAASFCDTICLKEPIQFNLDAHPLKPYVRITVKDCKPDTLLWSYIDMGINRKMILSELVGAPIRLNPSAVDCFIKDTSYAWLSFNDCSNGRGYLVKIPFDKKKNIDRKTSALNRFDPKFSVTPGLLAYSDRGNVFAEDMATGKKAMMTFGERVEIDYDAIHETVDSVSITPTHIWAKVKMGTDWKVVEKDITLQ